MAKLRFGAFLAPHHPVGEHPMLLLRRDLDFAVHLDRLGYRAETVISGSQSPRKNGENTGSGR
jgi:hypothetical protein